MTPDQEQAYRDGYTYGVEQAVQAHEDLIDVIGEMIRAVCDQPDCEVAMQPFSERTQATMAKVAALRGDDGEQAALDLYRIERA